MGKQVERRLGSEMVTRSRARPQSSRSKISLWSPGSGTRLKFVPRSAQFGKYGRAVLPAFEAWCR
jgi:hypothetical protein